VAELVFLWFLMITLRVAITPAMEKHTGPQSISGKAVGRELRDRLRRAGHAVQRTATVAAAAESSCSIQAPR